jgi:hypothetical protein
MADEIKVSDLDDVGMPQATDNWYIARDPFSATDSFKIVGLTDQKLATTDAVSFLTVDGRDVASDGAKLDTIESGADVTDSTNVVASLNTASIPTATPTASDLALFKDVTDSNNLKSATMGNLFSQGFNASFGTLGVSGIATTTRVNMTSLGISGTLTTDNFIRMDGATSQNMWIHYRSGSSPIGRSGNLFSCFGATHYFLDCGVASGPLTIKFSNENSDTPAYSLATTLASFSSTNTILSSKLTLNNNLDTCEMTADRARLTIYGTNDGAGANGRVSALVIKGQMSRNAGIFFDNEGNTNQWLIGREYAAGSDVTNLEMRYLGTRVAYFDATGVHALNLVSGNWTPTTTTSSGPINTITYFPNKYIRVGSRVSFSGRVSITSTAASGTIVLTFSLPIASNFTTGDDAMGSLSLSSGIYTNLTALIMDADATNDGLRITISKSTASIITFDCQISGHYEIK